MMDVQSLQHVLVVDDNPVVRRGLAKVLQHAGFAVCRYRYSSSIGFESLYDYPPFQELMRPKG